MDVSEFEERRGSGSGSGDRRRYNRRSETVTPPYYEVFERIAVALEAISEALVKPSEPAAPQPRPVGRPRGSGRG